MLKAAAGGGGKGMRLVHAPADLNRRWNRAKSEAQRAFGDDEVYHRKSDPESSTYRSADSSRRTWQYRLSGERECSIQRRHQKVIEESPSAVVDPDLRQSMGEVAVRVAKAANYTNAGTIEFLLDQE